MLERCLELLRSGTMGVLATSDGEQPHTSLMGFIADEDGRRLWMVSSKDSQKWLNIAQRPRVSFLVDTREECRTRERSGLEALTVEGHVTLVDVSSDEGQSAKARLLKLNPYLEEFFSEPDCVLFYLKIHTLLLLTGINTPFHFEFQS
ncbi:pyridoxamine 5'-phosphate oxidase family protein [Desulfobaculum bizertense]|uniref:Uncharacterized protein, pyridoxamine 5'-phosphate oxidase (PNPOx-like) family n=1 Tax=Desulfobaculum bizertense DSM 18034 TaxID=1121442 RepID=A0A1T4X1C0_9BACT|nr:pyridoxamine 5'-phosphate oxidase family protein [Desulfobaculum bizertense]SKA83443.1 Uncharacterized protein, pyridoxamine 5'-phosphate oxidase (PNPOx-like) family [Desulfobaculum bizertense DSM 18034]